MNQHRKRSWKLGLSVLLAGGGLLFYTAPGVADPGVPGIGTEIWQQKYSPSTSYAQGWFRGVGFNTDGSVLVNGFRSEADSGTAIGIRYNAATGAVLDAVPEWFLFEYDYFDYAHDRFLDQYIDESGNVYFVGKSYRSSKNSFSSRYNVPNIWKYSSSYNNPNPGNPDRPLWKNYYVGSGSASEEEGQFESMAMDTAGNIVAAGYHLNLSATASNRDWIIDKFSSVDGSRIAGFPISHNADDLHDYASEVATDSVDNFVVVGTVRVDAAADHYDWAVRKYSSDGNLLWETQNDLSGLNDHAFSVVIDAEDNVIVAGYRTNALPAGDSDWYIVKYAKDGDGNGGASILWEQSWDDGSASNGTARGMLLDHKGFIYIIGNQYKGSIDPAYTDRYRPVLQYRHGGTGELLGIQDFVLDKTVNDKAATEHDYMLRLALKDDMLVMVGYTQQDGAWSLNRGKTGRVLMLKLLPFFADGFE